MRTISSVTERKKEKSMGTFLANEITHYRDRYNRPNSACPN